LQDVLARISALLVDRCLVQGLVAVGYKQRAQARAERRVGEAGVDDLVVEAVGAMHLARFLEGGVGLGVEAGALRCEIGDGGGEVGQAMALGQADDLGQEAPQVVRTHCGDDGVQIGASGGGVAEVQRQFCADNREIGIAAVIARLLHDLLGADDSLTGEPQLFLGSVGPQRGVGGRFPASSPRGTAASRPARNRATQTLVPTVQEKYRRRRYPIHKSGILSR
jgi:hypothetical protein